MDRLDQQISNLLSRFTRKDLKEPIRSGVDGWTGNTISMRLVSKLQSDPADVKRTRQAEQGSLSASFLSCRRGKDTRVDALMSKSEEELEEL